MAKKKSKQKAILPPELPPEIPDDEVEVSDEDIKFVSSNQAFAGFASRLDTHSINKQVTRVAKTKEDELEALYERRLAKKKSKGEEGDGVEVDRVDALPVKTLDGELRYRTVEREVKKPDHGGDGEGGGSEGDGEGNEGIVKLTKAERRAKMKKKRKEVKKLSKEQTPAEEIHENRQSEVLAEVKEDLTAEEVAEKKQQRIAELGTALLSDPESSVKSLKELLSFCMDKDEAIAKAGLLSCLVVFRDIIPGYRIRLPTEKEQAMNVSKVVKKLRYFESTLLSSYKAYLQRLITLEKLPQYHRVVVRCLCTLLDAHPHFNFRENLLQAVVWNLSSSDDVERKLCSSTIRSLFTNEGKHSGEATIEAVQLIANLVKIHDCQLHPDSIEVFLALSFDDDLISSDKRNDEHDNGKHKQNKKRQRPNEQIQPVISDKKRSKQELMSRTREEVNADFKAASLAQDVLERRRMQTETLSSVFETYFRILKHTIHSSASWSKVNATLSGEAPVPHPLLTPCLKGVGMFAHFIDIDFMADLMKHLKILASGGGNSGSSESLLTVSERIDCCIVAFKVMRKNLDALNVDLQDFFIHFYNLILEYRPGRDRGEVLAEALKIMLCDDRQHDMQRASAFIKRLGTSSLCLGAAESMAALVTVKNLLQKNVKCRYMLENDVGGGSLSGSVAKYQPYSSDPHLSGALASVLWELNLLAKHFHPAISTMASTISKMSTAANQVYLPTISPQQAFKDFSLEKESFTINNDGKKVGGKRKRASSLSATDSLPEVDEDGLRKKLSGYFTVVRDIVENERLRRELDRTTMSLKLHEEYKKQRKSRQHNSKRKQKSSQ